MKYSYFVSFSSLYVLATLLSVLGKCRSVPLPYLFVFFLPFKVFLIIYKVVRDNLEFAESHLIVFVFPLMLISELRLYLNNSYNPQIYLGFST